MTEQYATDTSSESIVEAEVPLKVEITNQPKEKEQKNPTSEDTEDTLAFNISDEEKQEMQDAQ